MNESILRKQSLDNHDHLIQELSSRSSFFVTGEDASLRSFIDPKFLGKFVAVFSGRLTDLFTCKAAGIPKPVIDVPIKIWQNTYTDRFALRPERVPTTASSTRLSMWFKKIIARLAFVNTAVFMNLDASKSAEEMLSTHEEMIRWLYQQTFDPEVGLPIVGNLEEVPTITTAEHFGRVQKHLLDLLSERQSLRVSLETARSILQFWYQKEKPSIWNSLGKDEGEAIMAMKEFMYAAVEARIKWPAPVNHSYNLGDFMIRSLREFPETLKPQTSISTLDTELEIEAKNILHKLEDHSIWEKSAAKRIQDIETIEGLPVQPIGQAIDLEKGEERLRTYTIRILDESQYTQPRIIIVRHLKFLIHNLHVCHGKIIGYLSSRGIQSETEGNRSKFFEWFQKSLFEPENSLPVFGPFKFKWNQKISFNDFGMIQRFLLVYLSDSKSHERAVQASLALLGFWYRQKDHNKFVEWFKSDTKYWSSMIMFLEKDSNLSGRSSSHNFLLKWSRHTR